MCAMCALHNGHLCTVDSGLGRKPHYGTVDNTGNLTNIHTWRHGHEFRWFADIYIYLQPLVAAVFLPLVEFLLSEFSGYSCILAAISWVAQGMGPLTGQ